MYRASLWGRTNIENERCANPQLELEVHSSSATALSAIGIESVFSVSVGLERDRTPQQRLFVARMRSNHNAIVRRRGLMLAPYRRTRTFAAPCASPTRRCVSANRIAGILVPSTKIRATPLRRKSGERLETALEKQLAVALDENALDSCVRSFAGIKTRIKRAVCIQACQVCSACAVVSDKATCNPNFAVRLQSDICDFCDGDIVHVSRAFIRFDAPTAGKTAIESSIRF